MSTFDIVRYALVFVHVIGFAAVIGSYILQMPWRRNFDFRPLVIGSTVALLSGLALVTVHEVGGDGVNGGKIATKLGIALIVLALSLVGLLRSRALRRTEGDDAALKPLLLAAGLAAMVNVAVALFWR